MAHPNKEKVVTTEESSRPGYPTPVAAAAYLSKSRSWLDKKARSGEIPFYRIGKSVLFKFSDLDAYVEQHRVDPNVPAAHEASGRKRGRNGKFSAQGQHGQKCDGEVAT
jgi:excisionase family DNA binding protein